MTNSVSSVNSSAAANGKYTQLHAEKSEQQSTQINNKNKLQLHSNDEQPSVGEKQRIKMLEQSLKALEPNVRAEVYYQDNSATRLVIQLFNADTGDLIREIPPEKTMVIIDKLNEIRGVLIDEKV